MLLFFEELIQVADDDTREDADVVLRARFVDVQLLSGKWRKVYDDFLHPIMDQPPPLML